MSKKVLLVGLRSASVDFAKWPQLSVEKLEAAFQEVLADLRAAGFEAEWCLTDTGETAERQLVEALTENTPDVVLIGAGVRTDPDLFLLFERMVNVVHREAPSSRIAFNTLPFDSVEAVRRWV